MKQIIDCETILTQEQDYFLHAIDMDACQEKITKQLQADSKESTRAALGTSFVDSHYYEYSLNPDEGVQSKVWFQEHELAKIEVYKSWSINKEIEQAITDLGAPTLKLDYYLDVIPMKNKAWIYPEQGIAIFFGITDDSIDRVVYFKATSSEDYLSTIHNTEKPREFEM